MSNGKPKLHYVTVMGLATIACSTSALLVALLLPGPWKLLSFGLIVPLVAVFIYLLNRIWRGAYDSAAFGKDRRE